MGIRGVVETCLYVDDFAKARRFWTELLGLKVLFEDDRLCALDSGNNATVLLFLRGACMQAIETSGGVIPPHDGSGAEHIGLAIGADEFDLWLGRLKEAGIEIESIVKWPRGGRSMYFRDPDNHLVELLTPGVWPVY